MHTNFKAALTYVERGFAVFPLVPKGKTPAVPGGFKAATRDTAILQAFFEGSEHNIGLPTGKDNGLVVLDFDAKSGGLETLEGMIAAGELPATYTVSTPGGGYHFYFRYPEGADIRNKAGLRPGMDVRGEGGYVVAPPSVSDTGGAYRACDGHTLEDITELPASLLTELVTPSYTPTVGSGQETDSVGEGGRNDYLTRMAGRLRRNGMSEEALYTALHSENTAKCIPPLPSYEVDAIASWAMTKVATAPVTVSEGASESLILRAGECAGELFSFLKDTDRVKGTPTGIDGLNKLLGGGVRRGEITAWHAHAKTGKNTLWHYLMFFDLERGIPAGYASRELTPETEVLPDLLSIKNLSNIRKAKLSEKLEGTMQEQLRAWPLYFAKGYGYFAIDDIKRWMDEAQTLGVWNFWMDHLHYMLEEPEEHKEASKLAKALKALVKERGIHVHLIIQPNKVMDGERLSLNSIKGGSAIGQAIDSLLLFERVDRENNISKLTLEVARSKLASPGHIFLQYDKDTMTFQEHPGPERDEEPAKAFRALDGAKAPSSSRGWDTSRWNVQS